MRMLPNWERTMPADDRVTLWLNGERARRLRDGRGRDEPALRFVFRDTAIDAALSLRRPDP